MSEELNQIAAINLGRCQFFKLGATTLRQLKESKKISNTFNDLIAKNKPDGIIILSGGIVKAVIEYKTPRELRGLRKLTIAIKQEIQVARQLCKVLIVTDGKSTYWVNALNGNFIKDETGKELRFVFDSQRIHDGSITKEEIGNIESLIDKIDHSISQTNDILKEPDLVDPSSLAKSIWQKIFVQTGKEPVKCLYNVVELFIFKFLSDVGVLRESTNFSRVYETKIKEGDESALKYYAQICRKEIKDLFPVGPDGTTVINGTIFITETGEPNDNAAPLFGEVIRDLYQFDNSVGSFKYIRKEFKTRLFETFLRRNAGIRTLGQYFTPRSVVKAMVQMSDVHRLKSGDRFCDPFCGVGGFVLETMLQNQKLMDQYLPKNGKITTNVTLLGLDKGTQEKDDERTIILAKANMLIYFSDILARYNSRDYLKEFASKGYNQTFVLQRSLLGTLARTEDDPYDIILTNPPYVTSGSGSLKRLIQANGLENYYTSGGRGLEALSLEWVIKNLKEDGQGMIIVPDGLLLQKSMVEYVRKHSIIEGIISLPIRTFYSTPKKTYILILRRKSLESVAEQPTFTYVATEIGETRDSKRLPKAENDLSEAVGLFNQFKGAPTHFKSASPKCKIFEYDFIVAQEHLIIDRWWSEAERQELGLDDEISSINEEDFVAKVSKLKEIVGSIEEGNFETKDTTFIEVALSNKDLFELSIGTRFLKADILSAGIPVYSANVTIPFGFVKESNLKDFTRPSIIWGIDTEVFDWNLFPAGKEFAITDHCGRLQLKSDELHIEYLLHQLRSTRNQFGFDRIYRSSLKNISGEVTILVPVRDGKFDMEAQVRIAQKARHYEMIQSKLRVLLEEFPMELVTLNELSPQLS